jgi:hypothetical protein
MRSAARVLLVFGTVCSGFLLGPQPAQGQDKAADGGSGSWRKSGGGGQARPGVTAAPLALKVEWVRPASQTGQVPVVQENIADRISSSSGTDQLRTSCSRPCAGERRDAFGVWSGECTGHVITFKHKSHYVDLSGTAKIRWAVKTSGYHEVRPVVKLADGTLLAGDMTFASVAALATSEFPLGTIRWIKLEPERAVTVSSPGGKNNEIWFQNPDLSKVDEIGFVDLLPGSGHGPGGWIDVATVEVFGKPIKR